VLRLPVLTGTIKRRLLINFRANPEIVRPLLPEPFRPKLHGGYAIVGICLIRLEHERPAGIPQMLGMTSENAAHRFAVEWTDEIGVSRQGVYISRRHTDSAINQFAGGRAFGMDQDSACFTVADSDGHVSLDMQSKDGEFVIKVRGDESDRLPKDSCFESLEEVSAFFEEGAVGYSPTHRGERLTGIKLWTPDWKVGAFEATEARSSYFDDTTRFPAGSIEYDHALIMRDLQHEWRSADGLL